MNSDGNDVAIDPKAPTPSGAPPRKERLREPLLPAHLRLRAWPQLRDPILLMAFEGWNDAGDAASSAARIIAGQRDGQRFASIDPEEFFVFTSTRPHVRLTSRGRRRIEWPSNDFYACPDPRRGPDARDLIVLVGTEPDLRWRQFANIVFTIAKHTGVKLVVLLGALQSDVPHTMPPYVSTSGLNAGRHPLLDGRKFRPSRYQGPTGIVSVLASRFSEAGLPVASIWGHAPHYIQATPNPVVTAKLVREVGELLAISFDLSRIEEEARQFDDQVRDAVAKDPEATAYVRELERQYREQQEEGGEIRPTVSDLPSGAAMVDALEEFLRSRRRPPGANPSAQ